MGTTLTHNVYLPDEGERNCYSGLAQNWQILDDAVGAIAGKANASHTHGNITNNGAIGSTSGLPVITGTDGVLTTGTFGNTAGTFCEGNDSRLSDARTPVAHTHTKSDVTDLLNSNFIPSANNSYDIGSSSYQWKSVYSQTYYYNGTQWGLDQANVWTSINTFTSNNLYHSAINPAYILKSSTMQEGVVPSDHHTAYNGYWIDQNGTTLGYSRFVFYSTGMQTFEVNLRNKATNGSFSPSGSKIQTAYQLSLYPNGNSDLKIYAHTLPNGNNIWDLGDSTHKWKTLNGVNPGALSLPDTLGTSGTVNVNYFNVVGYLNNTGTIATIPSTATYDGWLYINAKDGADSYIIIDDSPSGFGTSVYGNNGLGAQGIGLLCLICPIRKGHFYNVRIKSAGIVSARIYPAQGNV